MSLHDLIDQNNPIDPNDCIDQNGVVYTTYLLQLHALTEVLPTHTAMLQSVGHK